MRRSRVSMLVAWGAVAAVSLLAMAAPPEADAPRLLRHSSFAQPLVSYANAWLPDPVDEARLRVIGERLQLSEAQAAFARNVHGRYVEQYNALAQKLLPGFYEAAAEASRLGREEGYTQTYADALARVSELRSEFSAGLERLDASFFGELAPTLTAEQEGMLARAQRDRSRDRCRAARGWTVPVASPDLRPILSELDLVKVDRESLDRIDALLDAHEDSVTQLWCRFAALQDDPKLFRSRAHHFQVVQFGAAGDPFEAERRVESWRSRLNRAARQIRTANESRLEEIKALLPERLAEELDRTYRALAYPTVYRDDDDLYELYTRLVDGELSDEHRGDVEDLRRSYLSQHSLLSRRMVEEFIRWYERIAGAVFHVDEHAAHQATMGDLADQRRRLAADHRALLEQMLGEPLDAHEERHAASGAAKP